MNGKRFKEIKKTLGLTEAQMCVILDVKSRATLTNWVKRNQVPAMAAQFLNTLMAMTEDNRRGWLMTRLGAAPGSKYKNLRGLGRMARALIEQHGLARDEAFRLACRAHGAEHDAYSEEEITTALRRSGRKLPVISKKKLERMRAIA